MIRMYVFFQSLQRLHETKMTHFLFTASESCKNKLILVPLTNYPFFLNVNCTVCQFDDVLENKP